MKKQDFHDPITLEEIATIKHETEFGHFIFVGYRMRQSMPTVDQAAKALKAAAATLGRSMKAAAEYRRICDEVNKVVAVPDEMTGGEQSKSSARQIEEQIEKNIFNPNKKQDKS